MSRVGKRPVGIPVGVTVVVDGEWVRVKGPKGELATQVLTGTRVAVADGEARVSSERTRRNPSFGTMRAHVANNPEKIAGVFGRSEFGLPPLDIRF